MKMFFKSLSKSDLMLLGLTPAACSYSKENFWIRNDNIITRNSEKVDIMKIIKSIEESSLLIKGVNEKIQNEV